MNGKPEDIQDLSCEELRQCINAGIEQADRGELFPLDIQSIKDEVRRRLDRKGDEYIL